MGLKNILNQAKNICEYQSGSKLFKIFANLCESAKVNLFTPYLVDILKAMQISKSNKISKHIPLLKQVTGTCKKTQEEPDYKYLQFFSSDYELKILEFYNQIDDKLLG